MRLPTIKQCIEDAPFISFEQYFIRYVMHVQDRMIDTEFSFMLRNNNITATSLNVLLDSAFEELI